jgi:hypothetical protein
VRGRNTVDEARLPSSGVLSRPTWATWREALHVCAYPPHLRKTLGIAGIVGTILFAINQLDVVLAGRATAGVWIKIGLTYLVPFCVSNWGILVATRRPGR